MIRPIIRRVVRRVVVRRSPRIIVRRSPVYYPRFVYNNTPKYLRSPRIIYRDRPRSPVAPAAAARVGGTPAQLAALGVPAELGLSEDDIRRARIAERQYGL